LPDPPHAVDVGVVQVKSRIAGAGEDVSAGISAEGVMPATVDADLRDYELALVVVVACSMCRLPRRG